MNLPGFNYIKKDYLRSKVAKRIFLLFVICSLLPLLAFAYFSFNQVSGHLRLQAEHFLDKETKSSGMAIIQRFLFLENSLKMISMQINDNAGYKLNTLFLKTQAGLSKQFSGIALVDEAMQSVASAGLIQNLPSLQREEVAHIQAGNTLVLGRSRDDAPADIFMVIPLSGSESGRPLLFALVLNEYIWDLKIIQNSPFQTVILDNNKNLLFSSLSDSFQLPGLINVIHSDISTRNFELHLGSEKHVASRWNIFMPGKFLIKWTIMQIQKEEDILAPLTYFNKIFPLFIGLSILIVLLLTHSQIRRNLTPIDMLKEAIRKLRDRDFDTKINITSKDEFQELGSAFNDMTESIKNHIETSTTINKIGIALSAEKNTNQLIKIILNGAMKIVNADAGILYTVHESGKVTISLLHIKSRNLEVDSDSDGKDKYNTLVHSKVVRLTESSIFNNVSINVPDIYNTKGFNFSNNIYFDEMTGYKSQSSLSVPMKNHENEIIGVLQLINAQSKESLEIIPFSDEDEKVAANLASVAAVAMSKNKLLTDFKLLFDSLVKLIATAIDEKSAYAGGHCKRVPELTMLIAGAACKSDDGIFKNYSLTEDELYELNVASLLHDCGKVSVPSHIEDKSSKLEAFFDRIHLLDARFEILKRDAQISFLTNKLSLLKNNGDALQHEIDSHLYTFFEAIEDDKKFLRACNTGRDPMDESDQERLQEISVKYKWTDPDGNEKHFLSNSELKSLSITEGTITNDERAIINSHVITTSLMLESVHYPKSLRNVPKFARVHHERMDGKGYPHGLSGSQIPIEGRMIAIADIFEALTAHDRPYKRKYTLMEALRILGSLKETGHIDPDLFALFVREKVYLKYAEQHLDPDQFDDIDVTKIPGYACST
jgi:HD-GYP domain-containing protein (c-di-GMP phosphodiesterase class II)